MAGRKAWSAADDESLRLYAHLGADRVALSLDRSVLSVISRASVLGVPLGRCAAARLVGSLEGFLDRVEFDPFGGCWLWSAHRERGGYGTTKREGKQVFAHRLSWELHFGAPPKGLLVCHRCDVRACVNPAHLFLGTHEDNTRDMIAKGRRRISRTKIDARIAGLVKGYLLAGIGPTEAARLAGCPKQVARNIAYAGSWPDAAPIQPQQIQENQLCVKS